MSNKISTKTTQTYVSDLWKRHASSAEHRSCGDHCPPPFEVTHTGPGETVDVRGGIGALVGKGGRGKGTDAKSNYGAGHSDIESHASTKGKTQRS